MAPPRPQGQLLRGQRSAWWLTRGAGSRTKEPPARWGAQGAAADQGVTGLSLAGERDVFRALHGEWQLSFWSCACCSPAGVRGVQRDVTPHRCHAGMGPRSLLPGFGIVSSLAPKGTAGPWGCIWAASLGLGWPAGVSAARGGCGGTLPRCLPVLRRGTLTEGGSASGSKTLALLQSAACRLAGVGLRGKPAPGAGGELRCCPPRTPSLTSLFRYCYYCALLIPGAGARVSCPFWGFLSCPCSPCTRSPRLRVPREGSSSGCAPQLWQPLGSLWDAPFWGAAGGCLTPAQRL